MEFDFALWLKEALGVALALIPIVSGLTKATEKLGAQGKVQTAAALGIGVVAGGVIGSVVWGVPASYPEWVLLAVFGLVIGLESIGAYEVVKSAAVKAREGG